MRPSIYDYNFKYNWLHIPSGKRGTHWTKEDSKEGPLTKLQFFERLAKWNGQQPGVWQYWDAYEMRNWWDIVPEQGV